MPIESSREIEKMFNNDIRDMKRIGSNVHKMTGKGKKGGIKGGIRFAKNNFKKYEKNSRVSENILYKDIIPYEIFTTLSIKQQKKALEEWRKLYTTEQIYTKLGISREKFYDTVYKLGIERRQNMKVNEESVKLFEENVDPKEFEKLPDDEKFQILDYYQNNKGMTTREMARILGYEPNTLATYKSRWKRVYLEKEAAKEMDDPDSKNNISEEGKVYDKAHQDSYLIKGLESIKEDSGKPDRGMKLEEQEDMYEEIDEVEATNTEDGDRSQFDVDDFVMQISATCTIEEMKAKVAAISAILDKDRKYVVSINIESTEE